MTLLTAVVRAGRLELPEPLDLPDGTELRIEVPDDAPPTPEEIACALAAMERFVPLEFSDEEEVAWQAERASRKAAEKSAFFEQGERLRSLWDAPVSPR